jgi:hypothetical protein
MRYHKFPEDFNDGESIRCQVIHDIFFAPIPPSIEEIIEHIPQASTHCNAKTWTTNNKLWTNWTVGAIHKAWEIRNSKNIAGGWGSQGGFQRCMLENHMYESAKQHSRQLNEQQQQVDKLYLYVDKQQLQLETQQKIINELWSLSIKQQKKDEWIDIEASDI